MRRLTVPEAAQALGITTDAIRMRLSRGTLDTERVEGRVYVLLEDDVSADRSGESSALISEMRDQIEFLRRELERRDQLLAAALSRIPEIEAPSDERGSPVTAASPGPRESLYRRGEGTGGRRAAVLVAQDVRRMNFREAHSLLKKSLSARSAVQKRPETRLKHYVNVVFSPGPGG